jgi:serine phosphatase RsbU (regulator of sigma subunit)
LEIVRAHLGRPARETVGALFRAVQAHRGPQSQVDDMTAVIVTVGPLPPNAE